jgi:phage shock protein PspC (stress-responsive transcriptional regulator)
MLNLRHWKGDFKQMGLIQKIALFFELRSFGVSTWFARKMSIEVSKVRLFFIYASFIALGSPVLIYLAMAFILEHKHIFKLQRRRKSIWEL